jgi:capsid protein
MYDWMSNPQMPESFWLGHGIGITPNLYTSRQRGEVPGAYWSDAQLRVIRDISRDFSIRNEFAVGALKNRKNYIVGNGMTTTFEATPGVQIDRYTQANASILWGDFARVENVPDVQREMIYRLDRDGEFFLRMFRLENGVISLRFVPPEFVITPPQYAADPDHSFGVHTPHLDPAGPPLGYWIVYDVTTWIPEYVPANQVIHVKANVTSDSKRGLPVWFSVAENLTRVEGTLRAIAKLAQLVARYGVVRKHQLGGTDSVRSFARATANDTMPDGSPLVRTNGDAGIADIPANIDLQFPAGELQLGGYVQAIQTDLRAVGAMLVMPEYMISGDASNGNYSSLQVAESPAIKEFASAQTPIVRATDTIASALLAWCGAWSMIGPNWVFLRPATVPPTLVRREPMQETQRNQILFANGVITKEEWRQLEGI